jgi:predicted nucleic acid-binding Zn ribbon protein
MAFVVICIFFGVAGGIVGRLKGSSFLLWFLIAGIVPFLGLIAAVLYRVEHDEPHRRCPTCGKVVPVYDALCTRCGTELEYPEPEVARQPVAAS